MDIRLTSGYMTALNRHLCRLIQRLIAKLILAVPIALVAPSAFGQNAAGNAPCGVPMFVYQTGMGGLSTFYAGRPVILLDPGLHMGDPLFREFTIQHECGHHAQGHTLPTGLASSQGLSMYKELEADCYAAREVSATVSEHTARVFERTQGASSPAPGYPTGNARAQNIRRCAGATKGPSKDVVIDTKNLCDGLKAAVDAAPDRFRPVRGQSIGGGNWSSTVQIDKFKKCYIQGGPPAFFCTSDQMSFKEAFDDVSACLTGWTVRRHSGSKIEFAWFERDDVRTNVSVRERPHDGSVAMSVDSR